MKPPVLAPAYVYIIPVLTEIAQENGYTIAVHGSMHRDLDLIAIPWTNQAVAANVLVDKIMERLVLCDLLSAHGNYRDPVSKPHGRLVWTILLGGGASIDLGVMPRKSNDPAIGLDADCGNDFHS